MSTLQQTLTPDLPTPSRWARLRRNNFVRGVLGILACVLPMTFVLILSEQVPKSSRVAWPLLLGALAVIGGYRLYVRWIEQRDVVELATQGAPRELGAGLGIGTLLVAATSLVLMACGAFTVTGLAHWSVIAGPLPEQIMVAFLEEILFRAIAFRLLEQSWGSRVALVVSTLLFMLAHLPNEHFSALGAVNTGAASLAFSGAYLVTRRLWLSIGMHFAWNYLYAGVLSVPVSGHPAHGWAQVTMQGPEWLSGGLYGVEGSIVTLVTWGSAAIVLLTVARRRGRLLRKV